MSNTVDLFPPNHLYKSINASKKSPNLSIQGCGYHLVNSQELKCQFYCTGHARPPSMISKKKKKS